MDSQHLTSQELEQLTLISKAVFANPFSEERVKYDLEITNVPASTPQSKRVDATVERVREVLAALGKAGKGNIRSFEGKERLLLTHAHLFLVFHTYVDQFDELIHEQIKAGEGILTVPFADQTMADITKTGVTQPEACRYFAMFYQIRRAFYFIDRSLTGTSASMRKLKLALWNNVFTHDMELYEKHLWNRMEDFSTLLLGETGTGKGAAATAIGRSGYIPFDDRKKAFTESFMRSFISINLSQFPETLIESELFGHRKGAFTGAVEAHPGVFARCSPHGAIFIDEIGDVSTPVQIKLLQVLQTREFSPVGSHEKLRFRGRVIAATNKSIDDLRRAKIFRDDFFYRLCSDVIVVPSLRQRISEDPGELDSLVNITVRKIIGECPDDIEDLILGTIKSNLGKTYNWPGNVRELEQCVRRILLTKTYAGDDRSIAPDRRSRLIAGIDDGTYSAQALMTDYCNLLYERFGTYEETARRTGLDRRTAKKYVTGEPDADRE